MTSRRALVATLVLTVATALTACSSGGDDRPTLGPKSSAGSSSDATTSTTLAPGTSQVAQAIVPNIGVYDAPDAPTPRQTFENPWHINDDPELGVPLVFLVTGQQESWVQVLLPVRPNGSTGWVHANEVRVSPNPYRIDVELGAHRLTVHRNDDVVLRETVAVGAPDTPTPVGKYYLRVLLKSPDPDTVYGPYAYGLSGHSDVLEEFNGGDGELGIHGNNDASVLGQSITHGCVRMSNDGITRLTTMLPLGTPVDIAA